MMFRSTLVLLTLGFSHQLLATPCFSDQPFADAEEFSKKMKSGICNGGYLYSAHPDQDGGGAREIYKTEKVIKVSTNYNSEDFSRRNANAEICVVAGSIGSVGKGPFKISERKINFNQCILVEPADYEKIPMIVDILAKQDGSVLFNFSRRNAHFDLDQFIVSGKLDHVELKNVMLKK